MIAGLCAGWVTVRLSPDAPYRHAVGVGLVPVLLVLLLLVRIESSSLFLSSLTHLAFLPLLFFGAWIGVRSGPVPRDIA
jgi:hypothetical protein